MGGCRLQIFWRPPGINQEKKKNIPPDECLLTLISQLQPEGPQGDKRVAQGVGSRPLPGKDGGRGAAAAAAARTRLRF